MRRRRRQGVWKQRGGADGDALQQRDHLVPQRQQYHAKPVALAKLAEPAEIVAVAQADSVEAGAAAQRELCAPDETGQRLQRLRRRHDDRACLLPGWSAQAHGAAADGGGTPVKGERRSQLSLSRGAKLEGGATRRRARCDASVLASLAVEGGGYDEACGMALTTEAARGLESDRAEVGSGEAGEEGGELGEVGAGDGGGERSDHDAAAL